MQACSAYYRLIPGVMKSRFLVLICGFVMLHVWQEEDLNPNHQIKFVGICWKGSWPSFVILVKNRRNEVWRLVCRNFVNGNVIKFRTLPSKKTAIKNRNDFQDISNNVNSQCVSDSDIEKNLSWFWSWAWLIYSTQNHQS